MDYYKILEVPKNADIDTIKRSYRRLASKWHPDKNRDNRIECENKFKAISEAYDTLKDPEKRSIYDTPNGMNMNGRNGMNMNMHSDMMSKLFSMGGGFTNGMNIGGGSFGNMTSVNTQTYYQNGKRVTKKVTTRTVNGQRVVTEEYIM